MIKQIYLPVLLILLCAAGWTGCTSQRQPCLTPKTATLSMQSIHFKSDTATVPVDTSLPSAVFSPVAGSITQYKLYPPQSKFTVSLSPDTTFCQWVFTTDTFSFRDAIVDTINFYYRRHLQFLSNACGFTYFYDLDSVRTTHLMIDSVHILKTSVTNNVNTEHMQVYIHRNF